MRSQAFAALRAVFWTLLQLATFLVLFEGGKALAALLHGGQRFDIGRGLFWYHYALGFGGLALIANAVLEVRTVGTAPRRRMLVWAGVFAALVAYSVPSWTALPLAVPFVHACALGAIGTREFVGAFLPQPSHPTSA